MHNRGFRVGWVAISYFMIAGGLVMFLALYQLAQVNSKPLGYTMCFLGAAFGGFFAGRASEGKTIMEPAVGALLVVGSFVAVMALVAGFRSLVALKSDQILGPLLLFSAVLAAGGIVGATLGERTSTEPRSESGVRWAGVASLITLGQLFMFLVIAGALLLRGRDGDAAGGIGVACMALAALAGGFAAQAVAPRRMSWAIGFGFALAMLPIGLGVLGDGDSKAAGGFIIIALIGVPLAAGGARLGWELIGKKYHQTTEQLAATFD